MSPLVSVIMPAYNHERYVGDSIRSVIAQDYQNIEFVILNDGSRDGTDEVIGKLIPECKKRFVRFEYINKRNEGVAVTMNRGVQWAASEFVSSISSDDLMSPDKISRLMTAMESAGPDVALVYADADFMDDEGQKIALTAAGRGVSISDKDGGDAVFTSFMQFHLNGRSDVILGRNSFDYEAILTGNFLPGMAMLWRKSVLERVGMFTPGIAVEDWDLWLRLSRSFKGVYVPAVVASYRWHAGNTVKTGGARLFEDQAVILERELAYARGNPRIFRKICRMMIYNIYSLVRLRRYRHILRLLDLRIMWAAFKPVSYR